jgi:cobalt/nickel transport system ATP-binding protein
MTSLLELRNVSFGFTTDAEVLSGLELTLEEHERLCVVGANGAGKSTLLHALVGLVKPSSGQVWAFGRSRVTERDFQDVRRAAGLLFQDPDDQLFCPTVAEDVAFGPLNLGYSKAEASAIVDEVLEELALSHLAERVTYRLSGGEKRLAALACVLAMRPRVLLLDEPSTGLDLDSAERLVGVLKRLPQAMIVVSHDAWLRRQIATRTVQLVGGQLLAERALGVVPDRPAVSA